VSKRRWGVILRIEVKGEERGMKNISDGSTKGAESQVSGFEDDETQQTRGEGRGALEEPKKKRIFVEGSHKELSTSAIHQETKGVAGTTRTRKVSKSRYSEGRKE